MLLGGALILAYWLIGQSFVAAVEGDVRTRILRDRGFIHEQGLDHRRVIAALTWPWCLLMRGRG